VRYEGAQVLRIRNAWLSEAATQSQPSLIRCSLPVDKRSSENTPAQRSAGHPAVRSVSVTKPNRKESSVGEGYE
jgi:hypothetical protein